jgi:hypothetical protein
MFLCTGEICKITYVWLFLILISFLGLPVFSSSYEEGPVYLEWISPWAYLRLHETKTLNTLLEPSLSVSLSPPPTSTRLRSASAPTKQRDREAGEPSKSFPASSPLSPSRRSHGDRHAEDKDIEDEVMIPSQDHLLFAALGCRVPCWPVAMPSRFVR